MSELASSIAEKKRLIIKNPDGSFLYCNKNLEFLYIDFVYMK